MKFGVRECADVVFRAKTAQKIGKKIFYKNEPVIYFDTLKTSSLEGAATTVYAQGGRGNPRLMSWDGERTVTFTMEDALISPIGLAILSGAGLIEAGDNNHVIIQHVTEQTNEVDGTTVKVKAKPCVKQGQETIYVMKLNAAGEVDSEPILYGYDGLDPQDGYYSITPKNVNAEGHPYNNEFTNLGDTVVVDYYTEHLNNTFEVNITPDKFGGAFYMEASTLWRDQSTQKDYPAEFIIPNLRVQSNFTFTMASSGDPSSFTFTCDAFPDYTRFDKTKKVLAQIQIMGASLSDDGELDRIRTTSQDKLNEIDDTIERSTEPVDGVYAKTNAVQIVTVGDTLNVADLFGYTKAKGSSNPTFSYTSSNTTVATISSGVLTGADAGITEVTATAFTDKTASIVVKVVAAG